MKEYLQNLTKRWKHCKDWSYNNLAKDLMSHCAHGTLSLTLMRIPVNKLKKEDLRIRSLNQLFRKDSSQLHIEAGAPATESKRFKARKNAIEYIYPYEINTKDIEILGCVENFREIIRKESLKGLLLRLYKNQPELICIKTLQKQYKKGNF